MYLLSENHYYIWIEEATLSINCKVPSNIDEFNETLIRINKLKMLT